MEIALIAIALLTAAGLTIHWFSVADDCCQYTKRSLSLR